MAKGKRKGKNKNAPTISRSSGVQAEGPLREAEEADDPHLDELSNLAITVEGAAASPLSSSVLEDLVAASETSSESSQNIVEEMFDFSDRMLITEGLPCKQPPGRRGKPVKLISNLYAIDLLPDGNVYHYDVQITNKRRSAETQMATMAVDKLIKRYTCLSTKINRKVIDRLFEIDSNLSCSYAVYDGRKNLYAPESLKLKFPYKKEVIFKDSFATNREDIFEVTIKPVQKKNENGGKRKDCTISFEPLHQLFAGKKASATEIQEAIMALETIFRHIPALKYVPIGRSFFHPCFGSMNPLGGGVEIWFGYHQSARLGQHKLMINLNTSATTFFTKTCVLEYFAAALNMRVSELKYYTGGRDMKHVLKKLKHELQNVNIETTHRPGHKYSIVNVTEKSAADIEFVLKESGRKISVSQYFRKEYDVQLSFPHLPCVQVKPQSANIFFPLEVCNIVEGQHCRKELSAAEKSEMIKYTAQPPSEKFSKIRTVKEKFANYDNDEYLNQFNIKVAKDPIQVTGRKLEAPNINYSNQSMVPKFQPINGSWNIRGQKFYKGTKISSWCLLSLALAKFCNERSLQNFANELRKIGTAAGIEINTPSQIRIIEGRELPKELRKIGNDKIQLTVVVIPDKNKDFYRSVKQLAENEIGLITQCIDHKNVNKCNPSLLSNLWQKINTKLGGINHTLTIEEIPKVMAEPTIIMGADVSHASVTDASGISVAAVAGSLNITISRFAVSCKLQKNDNLKKKSLEIIVNLKVMVKNLLVTFYQETRQKPKKIIFFRDGVSEGQFAKVKKEEISSIKEACKELEETYKPPITFVVVQKRHHVRFKPADFRSGATGSEHNMIPGTVVDTDVVHTVHRDFFLCSHAGLKGTSRPAYYTVLEDENNFSADDFQGLTNYLCYNFARCSKSISTPVPVRYAHLAAYRIRIILPKSDSRFSETDDDTKIPESILKASEISPLINKRMYFV